MLPEKSPQRREAGLSQFGLTAVPGTMTARILRFRTAVLPICAAMGVVLAMCPPGVGAATMSDKAEAAFQRGDFAAARKLLQGLAEKGDPTAALLLGDIASAGEGTSDEIREAARWYRLAADKGLSAAQSKLAASYAAGRGVPQSDATAVEWYRRAAQQGDAQAAMSLGYLYRYSEELGRNGAESARWYRQAAENGHATAQVVLGDAYAKGEGVTRNPNEAAAWYRRAADQGDAQGQYEMAVAYARGVGVPRDAVAALAWVTLALDNPSKALEREPAAALAASLAAGLSKADLEAAQDRAVRWRPVAAAVHEIGSPDGTLRALVAASGPGGESRVEIVANGRSLIRKSFASADGGHGYSVVHAAWTPDSRFFVFSLTSSGGHQPWLFPTYAYSRRTNRLGSLEGRIGSPTDPDFTLSPPDVLTTKVLVKGGSAREVRKPLSEVVAERR